MLRISWCWNLMTVGLRGSSTNNVLHICDRLCEKVRCRAKTDLA